MIDESRRKYIEDIFKDLKDGTDKFQHNYSYVYASLPKDTGSIFEIGVDKGYSLLAWTRVFPTAHVFGIDTDPKVIRPDILQNPRIMIQTADVKTFETDMKFDVIVDDCLHDLDTISVAWYRFRDKFRRAYVIEDVRWDIVQQVYTLISHTDPDRVFFLMRCSAYKGDLSFAGSDSNCVVILGDS